MTSSTKAKQVSTGNILPVHLGKLLTPTSHRVLVIAMLVTQCTMRFSQKIKLTLPFWTKVKEKLLQGTEYIPSG